MKICFVSDHISGIGGLQRVVVNLLNSLANNTDNEIYLILNNYTDVENGTEYQLNEKVTIVHNENLTFTKYRYITQRAFRKIHRKLLLFNSSKFIKRIYFPKKETNAYQKFVEQNSIDIIIGVTPRMAALVANLAVNVKKIGWFHNTFQRYFEIKNEYEYGLFELYAPLLEKLDTLVVLTNKDKAIYEQKLSTHVRRIYNPLSFKLKQKSNLDNNNILFVGRLQYSTKGLDYLGDIIFNVLTKKRDAKFIIVGENEGDGREKLSEALTKDCTIDRVQFVGGTNDVISYYLDSSLLILTSRIEGFGLVVTEAMEAGIPVISFETEGPSEIITDKENGILIEKFNTEKFSDAIISLLEDRENLSTMGKKALQRADDFSINNILNEWSSLFNDLKTS